MAVLHGLWMRLRNKTSCWKHPSKKSEVSNRLIINIDFWLFELIFRNWNNQNLFDNWFFQNHKFSAKSQKLVLWINQLSASDFFKDVFHTYLFSPFYSLFQMRMKEEQICEHEFLFCHREIQKRLGVWSKTFRRFDWNLKKFLFFLFFVYFCEKNF